MIARDRHRVPWGYFETGVECVEPNLDVSVAQGLVISPGVRNTGGREVLWLLELECIPITGAEGGRGMQKGGACNVIRERELLMNL